MSRQGSLTVLHEPFSYLYYVAKHPERGVAMNPDPGRPHRYDSIRDSLLIASTSGPTFFKDMAYHCLDEVVQDALHRAEDEIRDRRMACLFLDGGALEGPLHEQDDRHDEGQGQGEKDEAKALHRVNPRGSGNPHRGGSR